MLHTQQHKAVKFLKLLPQNKPKWCNNWLVGIRDMAGSAETKTWSFNRICTTHSLKEHCNWSNFSVFNKPFFCTGSNEERLDVFVGFLSFHCIPAETILHSL